MKELVHILKNTRQHLMTGVSHMIPFVVSGGILLAVSVMLYGKGAVPDAATDPNLKKLFDIGVAGLTLMVPFLAAYIGYSIAERKVPFLPQNRSGTFTHVLFVYSRSYMSEEEYRWM